MLVLVSFVLVLAAAVTLVVGLLQSGLTLIYLSIACSVLAGVVLAAAVLRGRPEPKPAAAGRSFAPPPRTEPAQVPASVGAPASGAGSTSTWSAPTPPPPPPAPPGPGPGGADDAATKAAGTALLGRLRGRRSESADASPTPEPVAPVVAPEPDEGSGPETTEMAAVVGPRGPGEDFPIPDYERLRATELLARLPSLDRNELEAVRQRESAGKNRFTIMNRIDALLAAQEQPAWEVADDEWEGDAVAETTVIEAAPAEDEQTAFEAAGEVEDDEVAELVSPTDDFPIAGYDTLTVGQILPRLSHLDADQLAEVRAREQQGRARGTILDRIDRLATKARAGAIAMPAAAPPRKAPARKAPARKAPARKAPAVVAETAAPSVKKTARAAKTPIAVPPAPAAKRASVRKTAAAKAVPPPRKASARKVAPPVVSDAIPAPPARAAVKKARAAKKATKRI